MVKVKLQKIAFTLLLIMPICVGAKNIPNSFSSIHEIHNLRDTLKKDSLKTVKLNEVVVKSKQKIHGLEKEIYIPTMAQRRISADGYDLLRNMAIPQLDINVLTNTVQVHGKAVTFVVDGHIVTNPNDLKQILPRDILRVE